MNVSENLTHGIGTIKVPYYIPKKFCGILFVAEAPGKDEELARQPLVGEAGILFDSCLSESKIKREFCVIANTFRYRPEGNKIDRFFVSARIAEEQEIDTAKIPKCSGKLLKAHFLSEIDYLKKAIIKINPKVIITLGRIATWALLGKDVISEIVLQKSVLKIKDNKYQVIPCFHPASALAYRRPENREVIVKAMKLAKKIAIGKNN